MKTRIYAAPAVKGLILVFTSIFPSFEVGIADAISNFKWGENNIIYQKWTSPKLNYLIKLTSTTRCVTNLSGILFSLKLAGSRSTRVNIVLIIFQSERRLIQQRIQVLRRQVNYTAPFLHLICHVLCGAY